MARDSRFRGNDAREWGATPALEELQPDREHLLDLLHRFRRGQQDHPVMGFDDRVRPRDDHRLVAHQGADDHARGQPDFLDRVVDQGRGLQRLGLDHLGKAVPEGMHRLDAAAPHMLEDRGRGNRARADHCVDA